MAETSAVDALSKVDLFAGLSPKALKRVASQARTGHHAAGTELTVEGRDGLGLHLLLSGTAEVLVGSTTARTLGPGEYFGEISLIDGGPRSATVRATSEVEALSLPSWAFRPLLDEEPEIARALLLVLCERLRAAEQRTAR